MVERMGSGFLDTKTLSAVAEKIDIAARAASTSAIAVAALPRAKPIKANAVVVHPPASPPPSLLSLSLAETSPAPARRVRPPGPIPPAPHGTDPRPRGPLSQEEKAYRYKWVLCAYCGSADHEEEGCPGLVARNKRLHTGSEK